MRNPNDETVWVDRRVNPLALRWHAPGLLLALGMIALTAGLATTQGLSVKDTDNMLSGRMGLLFVIIAVFLAIDVIPRARRRPGSFWESAAAVLRERWPRRRVMVVGLGLLSFYATYLSYRNLKSFLPSLTVQDLDVDLIGLDRSFFLGHDPGPLLQNVLGTGVFAHILSAVYLFYLAFIPISLGAALIASTNPIPGLWYVTALGLNWALGIVSYYAVPSVGPIFAAPWLYTALPDTGVANLQQTLVLQGSEGTHSIAAFASLHVSVVLTAALIAHLLKLRLARRAALWAFLALTVLATLYFGWHYAVDDVAGAVIAVVAVVVAGLATGHLAVPEAWRRRLPNALTLARIAVVPVVMWLILTGTTGALAVAAALFVAASLTDALDGILARRWRVVSVFGTLADPVADKLLVLGSLAMLATVGSIAVWAVALIAVRELAVSVLRARAKRGGVVLPAGPLGKAKMFLQSALVVALLVAVPATGWLQALVAVTVLLTVVSGVEIALRARRSSGPGAVAATA